MAKRVVKNKVFIKHCMSISEFRDFILNAPYNEAFEKSGKRSSETNGFDFTGTHSFQEALDLLINGWHTEAELLTEKFNKMKLDKSFRETSKYDVVGFQASVPRYLQGIPTNMINKKKVPQKVKVLTLVKSVCYAWYIKREEIERDSLKTLQIVKHLEENGHRVNLEVVYAGQSPQGTTGIMRVRIKSANERLSVVKMAFPLVHPSMTRRLLFKGFEKIPGVSDTSICSGYGNIIDGQDVLKTTLRDDEIFIPVKLGDLETIFQDIQRKIK